LPYVFVACDPEFEGGKHTEEEGEEN
jgi:hypothetical protein